MSKGSIELEFADGAYTFALPLPQIEEIQRKAREQNIPAGIGSIFGRVLKGCVPVGTEIMLAPAEAEFYASDVIETIRQGLIGGGVGVVDDVEVKVTPALANRLVTTYVLPPRPLADSWSLAASILGACVIGYDPPKKAPPANERATETQTASTTQKPSPTVQ